MLKAALKPEDIATKAHNLGVFPAVNKRSVHHVGHEKSSASGLLHAGGNGILGGPGGLGCSRSAGGLAAEKPLVELKSQHLPVIARSGGVVHGSLLPTHAAAGGAAAPHHRVVRLLPPPIGAPSREGAAAPRGPSSTRADGLGGARGQSLPSLVGPEHVSGQPRCATASAAEGHGTVPQARLEGSSAYRGGPSHKITEAAPAADVRTVGLPLLAAAAQRGVREPGPAAGPRELAGTPTRAGGQSRALRRPCTRSGSSLGTTISVSPPTSPREVEEERVVRPGRGRWPAALPTVAGAVPEAEAQVASPSRASLAQHWPNLSQANFAPSGTLAQSKLRSASFTGQESSPSTGTQAKAEPGSKPLPQADSSSAAQGVRLGAEAAAHSDNAGALSDATPLNGLAASAAAEDLPLEAARAPAPEACASAAAGLPEAESPQPPQCYSPPGAEVATAAALGAEVPAQQPRPSSGQKAVEPGGALHSEEAMSEVRHEKRQESDPSSGQEVAEVAAVSIAGTERTRECQVSEAGVQGPAGFPAVADRGPTAARGQTAEETSTEALYSPQPLNGELPWDHAESVTMEVGVRLLTDRPTTKGSVEFKRPWSAAISTACPTTCPSAVDRPGSPQALSSDAGCDGQSSVMEPHYDAPHFQQPTDRADDHICMEPVCATAEGQVDMLPDERFLSGVQPALVSQHAACDQLMTKSSPRLENLEGAQHAEPQGGLAGVVQRGSTLELQGGVPSCECLHGEEGPSANFREVEGIGDEQPSGGSAFQVDAMFRERPLGIEEPTGSLMGVEGTERQSTRFQLEVDVSLCERLLWDAQQSARSDYLRSTTSSMQQVDMLSCKRLLCEEQPRLPSPGNEQELDYMAEDMVRVLCDAIDTEWQEEDSGLFEVLDPCGKADDCPASSIDWSPRYVRVNNEDDLDSISSGSPRAISATLADTINFPSTKLPEELATASTACSGNTSLEAMHSGEEEEARDWSPRPNQPLLLEYTLGPRGTSPGHIVRGVQGAGEGAVALRRPLQGCCALESPISKVAKGLYTPRTEHAKLKAENQALFLELRQDLEALDRELSECSTPTHLRTPADTPREVSPATSPRGP